MQARETAFTVRATALQSTTLQDVDKIVNPTRKAEYDSEFM